MCFLCTVGIVYKEPPGNLPQRTHFKNRTKSASIVTSDDIISPITMIFPSTKASRVSKSQLRALQTPCSIQKSVRRWDRRYTFVSYQLSQTMMRSPRRWGIEMLPMFNGEQSTTPGSETCALFAMEGVKRVSLTCNAPSIRAGNYFVATQTGSAYVRWD